MSEPTRSELPFTSDESTEREFFNLLPCRIIMIVITISIWRAISKNTHVLTRWFIACLQLQWFLARLH